MVYERLCSNLLVCDLSGPEMRAKHFPFTVDATYAQGCGMMVHVVASTKKCEDALSESPYMGVSEAFVSLGARAGGRTSCSPMI